MKAFDDQRPVLCLLLGLVLSILGCGSSQDGPTRYHLSGKVTYDGKPVPKGFIRFDPAEGNPGPGSGAEIKDGEFETPDGKGIIGGPHQVVITGWDGVPYEESGETVEDGKQLFPEYRTNFDFPKDDGEQIFEVPNAENAGG